MLDELGPTFVKFGQLLSTRPDIVPPDIIAELRGAAGRRAAVPVRAGRAGRRDRARPLARARIRRLRSRRRSPRRRSARSTAPRCRTGSRSPSRCSVRVRRARSRRTSRCSTRRPASRRSASARSTSSTRASSSTSSRRSIRQELDYRSEGRNAERFRRDWAGDPHVQVPLVYWSYTRERVLTLEFLDGIQVADVDPAAYTVEDRAAHRVPDEPRRG